MENGVQFLQSASPRFSKELGNFKFLGLHRPRNTALGEERLLHYDNKKTFYGEHRL